MKLEAVFWDYPKFLDEQFLRSFLEENKNSEIFSWLMTRFLEHGRATDALSLFTIEEISALLPSLRLSDYAAAKWQRLVEVYASRPRG
ncbi:MAG: hypothetical protein HY961_00860 [Ignavibacteriae bacterium]|nr:hypothetical protein [Ignavibacteriota bacterium]